MSNGKYRLKVVTTARDEREWLDMPKRIYKEYPQWVCPLDSDIQKVFDKSHNELFADGEAIRWTALDQNGKVVGRIAAFYDKEHALSYEQPTGGCGFFEAIDDQELANTLFDAAREWLSERGMEAMDGPVNFGSRDSWWGLLVEGFEFEPLYGNPYNPPYYKALFENYGFQNYFNQNSYVWRADGDTLSEIALEKAHRLLSNPSYHIERINMHDLEGEAENFRQIYNKAWSLFTGVKPMEKEEAQVVLQKIKPIIDPNLIYFAYHDDEPIGFFIMVPDLNRIIGKFNGKFGIINQLRLLWNLKVSRSCDRVFGLIFGITPDYHGKGVESAIMTHILETYIRSGRNRYKSFEFAWIGDFNPVMNRMIEKYVCAKRHKMHTTYRYLFDRTKEFTRCPRLGLKRPEKQPEK